VIEADGRALQNGAMDLDHFRRFARYNRWANQRLYAACGALTEAAYFAARPGFFPSLHKTLNHILAADRVWLGRIDGTPGGVTALDQILHPDLASLRDARAAEDARLLALIEAMTPARVDETLAYRNMAGEARTAPMRVVLTHLFNHQTHHRGQAHAMLSGTSVAPPPLDFIYFHAEDEENR
jgi:uncharacterized damage-inducible protein DinB